MKEQPECRVDECGSREWYLNDELHREDGPAIEHAGGYKGWWLHGKCHREDGPAVEHANGRKSWWLHGKIIHPEQIVDLHLSRGTFCYYDQEAHTLHFAEIK